jgi:hypothetical protein
MKNSKNWIYRVTIKFNKGDVVKFFTNENEANAFVALNNAEFKKPFNVTKFNMSETVRFIQYNN